MRIWTQRRTQREESGMMMIVMALMGLSANTQVMVILLSILKFQPIEENVI